MTEDYSICYYESSCFIINNTLHSSKIWYRLTNKECPDDIFGIFDIFQYYYGNFGNPNTIESSCSESEYGCCYYNNQCSFAMKISPATRNYMSRLSLYNEYITNNNGFDGVILTLSTKSNEPIHQAAQISRKRGKI